MANYNTKKIYNKIISDGGANYNSASYILIVFDNGLGKDNIVDVISNINVLDDMLIAEIISNIVSINASDSSISLNDRISINNNANLLDVGQGKEFIKSILTNFTLNENAYGNEIISIATTYFLIDGDNVLQPLNVLITRDTREEILSAVKNYTEKIPGKHGEYKFKTEIKGKILELTVVTPDDLTPEERNALEKKYARYLNPLSGEKTLVFSDDLERQYKVRYSGRINPEDYPTWSKFTIPFKISSPFIEGSFENTQIGSGTVENIGNIDARFTIAIYGPITNPSLVIGDKTLTYNGEIKTGETLTIDTLRKTAKIGDRNVLDNWCKIFPTLKAGEQINVVATNNIALRWRARWIWTIKFLLMMEMVKLNILTL